MQETTLHDLFNAISCGVEEWAPDGRVLYVNPIREKHLACPTGERVGAYAWETLATENERARLRDCVQNACQNEDPLLPLAVTTCDRQGSEFPEEIEWSRKRDSAGRVVGFIAIYHQNPLNLSRFLPPHAGHNQELELLKAINLSIAHDLNSSLAVIVANAESLRPRSSLADDPIRHHREQILEACERAKSLVQHIQSVGYEPAEPLQTVALGSLVRQTVHWARACLPPSCQVRCVVETTRDQIVAFPRSLHRLLEIFCLRAARILVAIPATFEMRLLDRDVEAGELKQFPGMAAPTSGLCLTLTLEAPALPSNERQSFFEPYLTLRQSGPGVGLHMLHGTSRQHPIPDADEALRTLWETATVNQIVHEHQGAIGLVPPDTLSPQAVGLMLLFPRERIEKETYEPISPSEKPAASVAVTPPRARLLIVAPPSAFPLAFRERLEFLGYEIEQVASASRLQAALQEATIAALDAVVFYDTLASSKIQTFVKRLRELRADLSIVLCSRSAEKVVPGGGAHPLPEADEIIPWPKNWREIDLAVRRVRHEFPTPTNSRKPAPEPKPAGVNPISRTGNPT